MNDPRENRISLALGTRNAKAESTCMRPRSQYFFPPVHRDKDA